MRYRIELALREEELKAERLASFMQALIVGVLFLVYLISPKGFSKSSQVWFEPVRLLFYIYLPVLLIRTAHIMRAKHAGLEQYAFLTIDILALTLLIFSFHIQYQQPYTLSLRAPTFAYYFIFIAMRCLSYNPFKVAFVGILSSISWGLITYYGLYGAGLRRSSNFSEFLHPDAFILGVEIDRILALLAVTAVCVGAVFRKRRLLEGFSRRSVHAAAMERFIGKEAFQAMAGTDSNFVPGKGAKRLAATMMIDLRGFSKLSYELSPEKIVDYLGQYHRIVATAVFKFEGSVDKYMGDGILAHFGAVTEQPDFAAKALLAAEEIYIRLEQWKANVLLEGVRFDFGVAVAVGEVIFGAIGHEERMEITVIGEAVNLSAKLEKHTKSAHRRILTTIKTFDAAKAAGFSPTLKEIGFPKSVVVGIPHTLDLVGLGEPIAPGS